jgi:N-ethylmaleimide reductase
LARPNIFVANSGHDFELATSRLVKGKANLLAFGRPFIPRPDLAKTLKTDAPREMLNLATLHGGGGDIRTVPLS